MRSTASVATGDRCCLHQIEELAPDMRHARSFLYQAVFIELVEASVGVGLKDATEVCQVPLRMFSLAVRRVGEPDCRSIERTGGAIVANVGPEPARLGLAGAWSKHGNRRVVAVQLVGRQDVAAQDLDQRSE